MAKPPAHGGKNAFFPWAWARASAPASAGAVKPLQASPPFRGGDVARGLCVVVLPGVFKRASANRPCLGPAMLRQRCETWRNKKKGLWQYHNPYLLNWCRGRDSNPHSNCHYPLKIACLPVPPPRRQKRFYAKSRSLASFFFKKSGSALFFFFMAMPEVPLRAARLAKVAPCG